MLKIYPYKCFCLKIFIRSNIPAIKFKIITMFPIKVSFKVKKVKHHKTFNIAFIIIKTKVDFGILSFLIQKKLTTANKPYIIVQTIGITILGIH